MRDVCRDTQALTLGNKNINPSLKIYVRCPLIVNNNKNLLKDDYSNSALCRFKGIK